MNLFEKDKKNLNVILFYCYEYFCQGILNSRYIGVTLTLEVHLCTVHTVCCEYPDLIGSREPDLDLDGQFKT